MSQAGFPVEMVSGMPVVPAPEEVDITNAGQLRTALLDGASRGDGTFVVDMSRTRFCDSAGLHALVNAYRRAQSEGGRMLLAVPGPAVLRMFELTGVDRLFQIFPDVPAALASRTVASAAGPGA
jgi:anti-sigma B factor antagonist